MDKQMGKLISLDSWFISLQITTLIAFLGRAALLHLDIQNVKQSLVAAAASAASGSRPPQQVVANWKGYVRSHNPAEGNVGASIVIVEFTDFQCPFCKSFNESIRNQLLSKYGDRIQMVFKHYPLESIHPYAKLAAVAAQCAVREGKFAQTRDIIFSNADNLTKDFLIGAGAALGMSEKYAECVAGQETLAEVDSVIGIQFRRHHRTSYTVTSIA